MCPAASHPSRPPRRRPWSFLAGVAVVLVAALIGASPATAHTDLDFTLPTDGSAVGEPVAEITVGFTQAVTLVGPGFEVLDPQGEVLTPVVATDDDTVFLLQLDPPLAGGQAAVRYEVRAQDGHTISGGFSFTVSVDAPTTTVTTVAPSTSAATTVPDEPTTTVPAATSTSPATSTTSSVAAISTPSDDSSSITIYLAIAGAVAVGAAAFLVIRSRASAAARA